MPVGLSAAVLLVTLHAPGGQPVYVNPQSVSSVREPQTVNRAHFAPGTRCALLMTNGQVISIAEDCATVRDKLSAKE